MKNLDGKIALVTGAGRGIGLGCAQSLAARGATIILNDRPGSTDLDAAAEKVRESGAECHAIEADVFERDNCQQLVADAVAAAGTIDFLISNPAFSQRGDFLQYDADTFDRTLQCTLGSAFHLAQLVARQMVSQGDGGKMVFISSVHGLMPYARAFAYNASKAGLNHLVRSMSVELIAHRINVNAIAPGWIDTPGERMTFPEDVIAEAAAGLPWGRMGRPDEIGSAAAFLCSAESDYITGVVLPVDGGYRFKDCLPDQVFKERG